MMITSRLFSIILFLFAIVLLIEFNIGVGQDTTTSESESTNKAVFLFHAQNKEESATKSKRKALLISVQNYYNGLQPLQGCDRDMEKLEHNLIQFNFEVTRIHQKSKEASYTITRNNIEERLKDLIRESQNENDVLIIAYSGHGIQHENIRYICPPDVPKEFNEHQHIPLYNAEKTGLLNIIENNFKGKCFAFIDACRTGTNNTGTLYPNSDRIYIFSACEDGQQSYEEFDPKEGRFMHFVNQRFNNVLEDRPLSFNELTNYVINAVKEYEQSKNPPLLTQVPVVRMSGEIGNLIIGTKNSSHLYSSSSIAKDSKITIKPIPQSAGRSSAKFEIDFIAKDITLIPSLNGEWWFQEMPWYLPIVRESLFNVLNQSGIAENRKYGADFLGKDIFAYLNTNTHAAKETIWKFVNSDECKDTLPAGIIEKIKELKEFNGTDLHEFLNYDWITSFNNCYKKDDEQISTAYYHTEAVLHHKLYELAPNKETKNSHLIKAKESYERARKMLNNNNPYELKPLLLFDYIRFVVTVEKDKTKYEQLCKELTSNLPRAEYENLHSTLFSIALYTQLAQYDNEEFFNLRNTRLRFFKARKSIEDSRLNNTGHPLIANYKEKFGWYLMDNWLLTSAKEQFETAYLIRQYNNMCSSSPVDMMYVTYGQHAMGTIARFTGNERKSREYFQDAKNALVYLNQYGTTAADNLGFMQKRLAEREASTLERLSDLVLYNGTKIKDQYFIALNDYQRAIDISSTDADIIKLNAKKILLLLQMKNGWEQNNKTWQEFVQKCQERLNKSIMQNNSDTIRSTAKPIVYDPNNNKTRFMEAKATLKEINEINERIAKFTDADGNTALPDNIIIPKLFANAARIVFDLMETIEPAGESTAESTSESTSETKSESTAESGIDKNPTDINADIETERKRKFHQYRNQMRDFLDRFLLFSGNNAGMRRDTMELRLHCVTMLIDADWQMNNPELAIADAAYLSQCLDILAQKEEIHPFIRPYYEKILQIQHRIVKRLNDRISSLETNPERHSDEIQKLKTQQQELLRLMGMNIQQMRNISALSSTFTQPHQEYKLLQNFSKGVLTKPEQSGDQVPVLESDDSDKNRSLPKPAFAGNPLIDPLTTVIFYFPDTRNVQLVHSIHKNEEKGFEEKGFVLFILADGKEIKFIELNLTRDDVINKYNDGNGDLKEELKNIWEKNIVKQLVNDGNDFIFVSWSDEPCWAKDSRRLIKKEMFPYTEEIENNKTRIKLE
ncbi:MAG: caspase family protein [Planctomycetaceae bacterium]|jgi:hypothetical protein|nr:caspase family protein [Planctomycetaceae bacterium]